jgi:SpoVK/Ycf46/Vps4 family AAA+-type ATPase
MKKISQELKRPFIEISGSDIYNKWTGMSEKNVELV